MSNSAASPLIDFPKLKRSFGFAWRGFVRLLETEQNARIHTLVTFCVFGLAVFFRVDRLEASLLFIAVILVFVIEIMNTAIEKFLDIVHPDNHHQIRYIKDAMAGAVLIASFIALIVGVIVFYPHVAALFSS